MTGLAWFFGLPVIIGLGALFLIEFTGLPLLEVSALIILGGLVVIMLQVLSMVLMEIFSLTQLALMALVLIEGGGLYLMLWLNPVHCQKTLFTVLAGPAVVMTTVPAFLFLAGPVLLVKLLLEITAPVLLVLTALAVLLMVLSVGFAQVALAPDPQELLTMVQQRRWNLVNYD